MKLSKSTSRLASATALTCLLGLASQHASAVVTLNGCTGGDFGNACSLAELVGGGNLAINGNQFTNFGLDLFAGRALNASIIRINTIDSLINPGFTLVDTGSTLTFGNGDSTFSNFSFNVIGSSLIQGQSLAMAVGNMTGDNSYAHVYTNVFDPTLTSLLGQTDVYCDGVSDCANSTLNNSALIALAVPRLSVYAGIDVLADAAGTAQINSLTMQIRTYANCIVMVGFLSC
ncbi:MAG: hypothetical protein V4568_00010 [Pseudomonadota bacterium]